jgi:mannosyltransferase
MNRMRSWRRVTAALARGSPVRSPSAVLTAAILLATALSLFRLGQKSLVNDEAFSVAGAKLAWPKLWEFLADSQANMGLYYGLLHVWVGLGDSERIVRALSVLFAIATVPTLYAVGQRLFGRACAGIACLLLAINPFFIRYAQQARGYSLVLFLVTFSSYLFLRATDTPSRRRWAQYAAVCILAVYAHIFAAFVIAAHAASILFLPNYRSVSKSAARTYLVILAMTTPLIVFAIVADKGQIAWIPRPGLQTFVGVVRDLASGSGSVSEKGTGGGGNLLLILFFVLCTAAVAAAFATHKRATSDASRSVEIVLLWICIPIGASFFLSFAKPIFLARYVIVALPPLILLAARGLTLLRRPVLAVAAAVIAGLSALQLAVFYREQIEPWRSAARHVVLHSEPHDGIVFYAPYVRFPFEYYLHRDAPGSTLRKLRPVSPPYGWGRFSIVRFETWSSDPKLESLERLARRQKRVWLVLSHNRGTTHDRIETAVLQRAVAATKVQVSTTRFGSIVVELYRDSRS